MGRRQGADILKSLIWQFRGLKFLPALGVLLIDFTVLSIFNISGAVFPGEYFLISRVDGISAFDVRRVSFFKLYCVGIRGFRPGFRFSALFPSALPFFNPKSMPSIL